MHRKLYLIIRNVWVVMCHKNHYVNTQKAACCDQKAPKGCGKKQNVLAAPNTVPCCNLHQLNEKHSAMHSEDVSGARRVAANAYPASPQLLNQVLSQSQGWGTAPTAAAPTSNSTVREGPNPGLSPPAQVRPLRETSLKVQGYQKELTIGEQKIDFYKYFLSPKKS